MNRKQFGTVLVLAWSVCGWALTPSDQIDPAAALAQSKNPLELVEQYLIIQDTQPVAAHRAWLFRKGKSDLANKIVSLEALYAGDTAKALEALALVQKKESWTDEREKILHRLIEAQHSFVETRSDHFVVRTTEDLSFLAPHALSSLETAYERVTGFLGSSSPATVPVEIYPTVEAFNSVSPTPQADIKKTGAATRSQYGRILALSPGATSFGYRWIDGLVHEFVHSQVTRLTRGNAPSWLQEGTARYLEATGRSSEGFSLSSFDRALLTRAALEGRASLSNDAESSESSRVLFSAVSGDAVDFLADEFGEDKLKDVLSAARRVPDPFAAILGIDAAEFERRWIESLVDLTETPTGSDRGAMGPSLSFGETDDLVLVDETLRPVLAQGDRFLKKNVLSSAVVEYKKAVDLRPDNGVALVRLARVYVREQKMDAARELLVRAKTHNLSYAASWVHLGEVFYDEGRYEEAQSVLQDALEINPFDPAIHETLGLIAVDVGNFNLARQSLGLALRLNPDNASLREMIDNMPAPR